MTAPSADRWLAPILVAAILAATLFPFGGADGAAGPMPSCLVCGERGLADALANVLLFLPLGFALWRKKLPLGGVVLAGAALSIGIEILQHAIPGRHPNPGDILFNTLGALAGARVGRELSSRARPAGVYGEWRTLGLGLAVASLLVGGAVLLAPADATPGRYSVDWTPDVAGLRPFPGRILQARLGAERLLPGPTLGSGGFQSLLEREAAVHLVAAIQRRGSGFAPLLRLRDSAGADALVIRAEGDAVLVQLRTRAAGLRLDQPVLRFDAALNGIRPGDGVEVRFWRAERTYCIAVAGRTDCSRGFSLGDTWGIILYPSGLSSALRRALALAWLAGLLVPVGLSAGRTSTMVAAAVGVAGLLLVLPRVTGIAATPPEQVAAALVGLVIGRSVRAFWTHRYGHPSTHPGGPAVARTRDARSTDA